MHTSNANVDGTALLEVSYQKVLPKLQSVAPQEFVQMNLDVVTAALTALGSLPEIMMLRHRVETDAHAVSIDNFDMLEDYARTVIYSQAEYSTACKPPDDLPAVLEEATVLHARLHADAMALVERDMLNPQALRDLRGANGYRNLGSDLNILTRVMRKEWPRLEGKCATSTMELEHAEKVAVRLMVLVAIREQSPARIAVAGELRARAFTVFSHAYDQVRRAVSFLRWNEGDADAIAPSLYAGRGGRGKSAEEKPGAGTTTGTEVPVPPVSPSPADTDSDLLRKPAKAGAGAATTQPFLEE